MHSVHEAVLVLRSDSERVRVTGCLSLGAVILGKVLTGGFLVVCRRVMGIV